MLKNLLELESLEPRTRYRPEGEEIDGSFLFASRVFLLEAKWLAEPIPASALYGFKSKVDGKLVGTLGVFLSMSGYSDDAVDALVKGKELNLILFDVQDFEFSLSTPGGFTIALHKKLRAASEEGAVYLPITTKEVSVQQTNEGTRSSIEEVVADKPPAPDTLSFVCEGFVDQVILSELLARSMSDLLIQSRVRILAAGGKLNLAIIANTLSSEPNQQIIIVADADSNREETISIISRTLSDPLSIIMIVPEPTLEEAWLGVSRKDIPYSSISADFRRAINEKVETLDFESLRAKDDAFKVLWDVLSKQKRY